MLNYNKSVDTQLYVILSTEPPNHSVSAVMVLIKWAVIQ